MTDCQNCEYHKNRAARWRAEAYKQGGHDVIELPWVGLTDKAITQVIDSMPKKMKGFMVDWDMYEFARAIEQALKEKNT